MILIPAFDPSNYSISDKIEYALNNQEQYNSLTGSDVPVAFINFILPGYTDNKPELTVSLISPNLVTEEIVAGYYNKDLNLYINYFGSNEDISERLMMYDRDLIIKQRIISPSWNIAVFVPIHSIEATYNKSKFNLNYGLSLVGEEVNLMNVQKYVGQGVTNICLSFMDITTSMSYIEAKVPLLKELSTKFPDTQFIICARDARLLKLPQNFKVVVGSPFWNELIH